MFCNALLTSRQRSNNKSGRKNCHGVLRTWEAICENYQRCMKLVINNFRAIEKEGGSGLFARLM